MIHSSVVTQGRAPLVWRVKQREVYALCAPLPSVQLRVTVRRANAVLAAVARSRATRSFVVKVALVLRERSVNQRQGWHQHVVRRVHV